MKEFIKSKKALKQSELANQIGWAKTSFNDWMKDRRPIPSHYAEKLKSLLEEYGYKEEVK